MGPTSKILNYKGDNLEIGLKKGEYFRTLQAIDTLLRRENRPPKPLGPIKMGKSGRCKDIVNAIGKSKTPNLRDRRWSARS